MELDCSYLCPECILSVNSAVSMLPEEVVYEGFFYFDLPNGPITPFEQIKCQLSGHILNGKWVTEGYSPLLKEERKYLKKEITKPNNKALLGLLLCCVFLTL